MTPRTVARAIITAGWLAGMTLILASLPLWAALAALGVSVATAVAYARWGGRNLIQLAREVMRLRRLVKRAGGGLERA